MNQNAFKNVFQYIFIIYHSVNYMNDGLPCVASIQIFELKQTIVDCTEDQRAYILTDRTSG